MPYQCNTCHKTHPDGEICEKPLLTDKDKIILLCQMLREAQQIAMGHPISKVGMDFSTRSREPALQTSP